MAVSVTMDASSPWFAGHFPEDPILPGIAQLKMVADLISGAERTTLIMTGLSRVKFRKIVRPGEELDIYAIRDTPKEKYSFRITSSNEEVCSGLMLFTYNDKLE